MDGMHANSWRGPAAPPMIRADERRVFWASIISTLLMIAAACSVILMLSWTGVQLPGLNEVYGAAWTD
jgi:hypothetical protein